MIEVSCHQCGRLLRVRDEMAGKKGRCPSCRAVVEIPGSMSGEISSKRPTVAASQSQSRPKAAKATNMARVANPATKQTGPNHKATISLVLGVVGMLIFLVPAGGFGLGIIALVLGIQGLKKADLVHKGKEIAVIGIFAASLSIVSSMISTPMILIPALKKAQASAYQLATVSQLSDIGRKLNRYAQANQGKLPPDLGTLVSDGLMPPSLVIAPTSFGEKALPKGSKASQATWVNNNSDFTYLGNEDINLKSINKKRVLAYSMEPTSALLYGDGNVKRSDPETAKKLISQWRGESTAVASVKPRPQRKLETPAPKEKNTKEPVLAINSQLTNEPPTASSPKPQKKPQKRPAQKKKPSPGKLKRRAARTKSNASIPSTTAASHPASKQKSGNFKNLAYGQNVKTSSENKFKKQFGINAVDNDPSTRWSASTDSNDEFLQVDLGTARIIEALRITWHEKAAFKYHILASADGEKWRNLINALNTQTPTKVSSHLAVGHKMRHLRIRLRGSNTPGISQASIAEFEVFDKRSAIDGDTVIDNYAHSGPIDEAEKRAFSMPGHERYLKSDELRRKVELAKAAAVNRRITPGRTPSPTTANRLPPSRLSGGAAADTGEIKYAEGQRRVINLIDYVNIQRDAVKPEKWDLIGKELICNEMHFVPKIIFPYKPCPAFEVTLQFSQPKPRNSVGIIVPNPVTEGAFAIGIDRRKVEISLGGRMVELDEKKNVELEPNRKYTARIRVVKNRIYLSLNGKAFKTYTASLAHLKTSTWHKNPHPERLGVFCDDPTTFHKISVRELNGTGFLEDK